MSLVSPRWKLWLHCHSGLPARQRLECHSNIGERKHMIGENLHLVARDELKQTRDSLRRTFAANFSNV